MRRWCLAMIVLLLVTSPVHAHGDGGRVSPVTPLTMGETFTIHSQVLDETRRINVYLPPPYAQSPEARFPVLYMPDGGMGEDFLHVAGLVQVAVGNGTMRPFLLVGIENTQRRRDMTGPTQNPEDRKIAPQVGGSAAFRSFIRSELMPAVNARYRTTAETAIMGESLAGLFVVETFFLEPELFNTCIAFDPSLWWNRHALLDEAGNRLRTPGRPWPALYFAGSSEPELRDLAQQLADTLRANGPASLKWHYEPMPGETHATIYHPAALKALRWLFSPVAQDLDRAVSVEREFERMAGQRALWPGYDPISIPLGVYTGTHTYLFRDPATPEGFSPVAGSRPACAVFEGRHPAVSANSSAEIGGTLCATLLLDNPGSTAGPTEMAATALHEAFHVYQRSRHKGWAGNEGDLFRYPTDDARLLGLRRMESEALRRALASPDAGNCAGWARVALDYRRDRFAGMDSAFAAYERLTELNEGLATYIQLTSAGQTTVEIPDSEFRATQVRARIYTIGPALAFLLDRLRPGWQAELEANDAQYLDQMLASAIQAGPPGTAGPRALPADDVSRIERTAQADVAAVITRRAERRKEFDGRAGWRVIIETTGQPLWPQGFDPLNVELVDGGCLHTRFLKLGNDAGELSMIRPAGSDVEALTVGAGPHPLFNGVRRVEIAGLPKPDIKTGGSGTTIEAPGFSGRFKNASVQTKGTEIRIQMGAAR